MGAAEGVAGGDVAAGQRRAVFQNRPVVGAADVAAFPDTAGHGDRSGGRAGPGDVGVLRRVVGGVNDNVAGLPVRSSLREVYGGGILKPEWRGMAGGRSRPARL